MKQSALFITALMTVVLAHALHGGEPRRPQPRNQPPAHQPPATPTPPQPQTPAQQREAEADQFEVQQHAVLSAMQQAKFEDEQRRKRRERPTVQWLYSIEDALSEAVKNEKPVAIYFCSAAAAPLAGEGQAAFEKYREQHDDVPSPTIFDSHPVPTALKKAGVTNLAKVACTSEHKALFKRYGVELNTLLLLAPTGEVLIDFGGADCNAETVSKYLNDEFRLQYEEWWGARQRKLEQRPK